MLANGSLGGPDSCGTSRGNPPAWVARSMRRTALPSRVGTFTSQPRCFSRGSVKATLPPPLPRQERHRQRAEDRLAVGGGGVRTAEPLPETCNGAFTIANGADDETR